MSKIRELDKEIEYLREQIKEKDILLDKFWTKLDKLREIIYTD